MSETVNNKTTSTRFLLTFVLITIYLTGGYILVYTVNTRIKKHALVEAENKARIITDLNLSVHTYFSHKLKPSVFPISDRLNGKSYFDPVWMSSTYAVRGIVENFIKLGNEEYYYKECAINARSPENEADDFERSFIEDLNRNAGIKFKSAIREINNRLYFQILRKGETMEKGCLRCHSQPENAPGELVKLYGNSKSFQRHEGEVISAISVRIPLEEAYKYANRVSAFLSGSLLLLLFIVILFVLGVNQRLVFKPLEDIRMHAVAIAGEISHLGESIKLPRSRELYEFTNSFNILSKKLKSIIDTLEYRVVERTVQLQNVNDELKTEITVKEKFANDLKKALEEREMLIKEIHHRVKNNFSIISSLISIKSNMNKDSGFQELLSDINARISSMLLIHENLSYSDDISHINLAYYIQVISEELKNVYNSENNIFKLTLKLEPVKLIMEQATSCGLLLIEILTNSMKHAFAGGNSDENEIIIESKLKDGNLRLSVIDNGIGLPDDYLNVSGRSIGMQLIKSLAKKLNGKLEIHSNNGTEFTITFLLEE